MNIQVGPKNPVFRDRRLYTKRCLDTKGILRETFRAWLSGDKNFWAYLTSEPHRSFWILR